MPLVSRAFVLTGLLYLVAAMALGVSLGSGGLGVAQVSIPYPVYVHLLAVGWLTQLIFGVAYWMFPGRPRKPSAVERVTVWSVYLSLNAGLLLRSVAEPMLGRAGPWPVLLAIAALAQLLAVLLFVAHLWPRVAAR
ncbi:MAG: hypothetical protein R2909_03235 [Gemmatimonadales bacterium]